METTLLIAIAYPAAIAGLFYLAFYRPMQQQQKRQRRELASLEVGDEVLTQAGFVAVIKEIRVPEEPGPVDSLPAGQSVAAYFWKVSENESPEGVMLALTLPSVKVTDATGGRERSPFQGDT